MGKGTYAMGVVASVHVRTMGGGGHIFTILVRTYQLNDLYYAQNQYYICQIGYE